MATLTRWQRLKDWYGALMRWERRVAPPNASRGRIYAKRQPIGGSAPTAVSKPVPAMFTKIEKANGDVIHFAGRGPGR